TAGGCSRVLALGAVGAALGTRMLATEECRAHPHYKQKLLQATEEDTEHTILFGHGWPHAPHRTLRTPFVEQWLGREAQAQESRADEPVIGKVKIAGQDMPLLRFMGFPPNVDASGEIDAMDLLAGQGVGRITAIEPAEVVIRRIAEEARDIAIKLAATV
ncbi:MAG: nitronate monooxygenase, partial [Rhizobiales bacterium]|nr:nitronate monooxygenase [Hyphomicrobiales bacterium]